MFKVAGEIKNIKIYDFPPFWNAGYFVDHNH